MSEGSRKIVAVKETNPSFIRRKGELSQLLKSLTRVSEDAVSVLIDAMTDSSVDKKTKISCAEKLLDFQISVAKEVNSDNMQRLIAEIKLNKQPMGSSLEAIEAEKNSRPVIDFTTIREAN